MSFIKVSRNFPIRENYQHFILYWVSHNKPKTLEESLMQAIWTQSFIGFHEPKSTLNLLRANPFFKGGFHFISKLGTPLVPWTRGLVGTLMRGGIQLHKSSCEMLHYFLFLRQPVPQIIHYCCNVIYLPSCNSKHVVKGCVAISLNRPVNSGF